MPLISYRPATTADYPHRVRALWIACTWRPREHPPQPDPMPAEVAVYHEAWGRHGDLGVLAEVEGHVVGAAFGRFHTADDPPFGHVADDIPEIGLGVEPGYRRRGIGRAMFSRLEDLYRAIGVTKLSLSVETDNPSRFLYLQLGYEVLTTRDGAHTMVKDL